MHQSKNRKREKESEPPLLSIALIVKNEDGNLPDLFQSLKRLGKNVNTQVVIVDTGSTDSSRETARSRGAEVYDFDWVEDFSRARNFGLQHCRAPWILWMDADDRLSPDAGKWIGANIKRLNQKYVYAFNIHSLHADGSESLFTQVRLFPNFLGLHFENPIHESLGASVRKTKLSALHTGNTIRHTGYEDAGMLRRKMERNRVMLEAEAAKENPPPSLLFSLARTCQVEEDFSRAEKLYRSIISQSESSGQADIFLASHIYLGQCLAFQNQLDEAVSFFRLNSDIGKGNAQFEFEFAKVLLVTGKKEEAISRFRKCLELGPATWAIPSDWQAILNGARSLLLRLTGDQASAPAPGAAGKLDLSVCSIIRNEEAQLPDLIGCIPKDRVEWIIVDTGSTDSGEAILSRHGVNPHPFAWCDDFSRARNHSLDLATRSWILWLDADDRLDAAAWTRIGELLNGPPRAYRLVIRSPRENGRGDAFRQFRLFPNHQGIRFEGRIHEQLGSCIKRLGIATGDSEIEILHVGYDTPEKRMAKAERNHELLRTELQDHPGNSVVVMEFANSLFQLNRRGEALDAYLSLMDSADPAACSKPQDEVVREHFPCLIAATHEADGNQGLAEGWYRLAVDWTGDARAHYWLGKRSLESGALEKAMGHFYHVTEKDLNPGRVASDGFTLRRNTLGFLVLCEIQVHGAKHAPGVRKYLEELLAGGLTDLPFDARVPAEFFRTAGYGEELLEYYRKYLDSHPADTGMWEDYLEELLIRKEFTAILECYRSHAILQCRSGAIEAFAGKSLEFEEETGEAAYQVYLKGLHKFPGDPTLLVYFADWVNRKKLFSRSYRDLDSLNKSLPSGSPEILELIRQLENQGLDHA